MLEQEGGLRVEVAVPPESRPAACSWASSGGARGRDARVLTGTVGEVSPQVDAAARAFVVKVDLPSDARGLNAPACSRGCTSTAGARPADRAARGPARAARLTSVFVVDDGIRGSGS
ncbi:MAG: hypothetical protein IPL19_21770 [Sandaracinaceae bacterium]|nr:hypothetical protein [Sandaracinaceae bacterium]